jgi:two-component system response regulator RpaA
MNTVATLKVKSILTTGQCARICKVAPRTISKWFDSGKLKGYRIPVSLDRRIPRDNLVKFMKEYGMPLGTLGELRFYKIITVGMSEKAIELLRPDLPSDDYKTVNIATAFEAGFAAKDHNPNCIIFDCQLGSEAAIGLTRAFRQHENYADVMLVALAGEDEAKPGRFVDAGFNSVLVAPTPPSSIIECIREHKKAKDEADE